MIDKLIDEKVEDLVQDHVQFFFSFATRLVADRWHTSSTKISPETRGYTKSLPRVTTAPLTFVPSSF